MGFHPARVLPSPGIRQATRVKQDPAPLLVAADIEAEP